MIKKTRFLEAKSLQRLENSLFLLPALILITSFIVGSWVLLNPSGVNLMIGLMSILYLLYGLPLTIFKLLNSIFPLKEGASYLIVGEAGYSPWMASNHIQSIYNAIPQLERFMRLVPGLYAAWLRAWGSKIGKNFMPQMHFQALDRSLLEIGNTVLFGHDCVLSGHIVRKKEGKILLFVKKIKIENEAFIGAFVKIGPGSRIQQGSIIPLSSIVSPLSEPTSK